MTKINGKRIDLTWEENTYRCNGCGKIFNVFEVKKKLSMPECPYCDNLVFFGMEKLTNHSIHKENSMKKKISNKTKNVIHWTVFAVSFIVSFTICKEK